jgi:hypothetical protein
VIYVTHGGSVKAQNELLGNSSEPISVEYCATTIISDQFELIGDIATSEHLGLGKAQFIYF